jgi:hypothetical protein
MIKLDVQDYCHDCDHFSPELKEGKWFYVKNSVERYKTDSIVYCTNRDICNRLHKEFIKKYEKENNND